MVANLQSLQAGEERRGSNASQTGDVPWRPCGSNLSLWEQMELRPLYKGSKGKCEQHKGRCQEEKKNEEIVKMKKSKAESISSWCYQHQAGSIKVHRRVVWSLIFFVFGVCMVKAEVQEE